ncbi:MAG: anti-sigma factor [Patiriisocius sp.]|uniref:anti-sigma factor n=1 Tax=Patiriisocius sp. TaxID=2822396 RepID=UPI003EFABEC7
MTTTELIESGTLELYVCGALPEDEAQEVFEEIQKNSDVRGEVQRIENTLMNLSSEIAPALSVMNWSSILNAISGTRSIGNTNNTTNWGAITGWAAALACVGGIFWMLNQNNELENQVTEATEQRNILEEELDISTEMLVANEELLDVIRSKDYNAYTLPGNQAVAPTAYSKVYFNDDTNVAYIDVKGLPKAPEGKVYQVWSLMLEPLTPTSVGLIDDSTLASNGVYKFENLKDAPQAFGITLEPAGGSESPTLSQLYTLGTTAP